MRTLPVVACRWMCSNAGRNGRIRTERKKDFCNVPLMRRPLARMAGWQEMDRARGSWSSHDSPFFQPGGGGAVVALVACISPPCLKLTDFSPQNIRIQARLFHHCSFAAQASKPAARILPEPASSTAWRGPRDPPCQPGHSRSPQPAPPSFAVDISPSRPSCWTETKS